MSLAKFSSLLWPDTKAVLRLPCSIHTLRWWRRVGRGPAFIRIGGRVYYRPEDIDAFLEACPRGGEVIERGQA